MSRTETILYRLQPVYNRVIRPYLPTRPRAYNGVLVDDKTPLDRTESFPDHEAESVVALRDAIRPGDRVVIVGGGLGVTAVHACWAGASKVTVYEGAKRYYSHIHRTAELNDVADKIHVSWSVVGDTKDVWGETQGADYVSAEDLPEHEVLELDCEGAEVTILDHLNARPHTMLIECHPDLGAPEARVREALPAEYTVAQATVQDAQPFIRARLE